MKTIHSIHAPKAIGPYSQAVEAGNWLFCSGQIPIDPLTGEFSGTEIRQQTRRVLDNLDAVLKEAGCARSQVVKTTVYLDDMDNFAGMNEVYADFFGAHCPARATVEVSRLPRNVLVEIDCIAIKGE